jgi:RNA polymerase sigma-70 factor (ECF subfamily)
VASTLRPDAPARDSDLDEVGQAILERWRCGDRRAFTDLFRSYRRLVYGVLFNLMPGDPELDDVVQSAFLEVFRSLHTFEGRSKLSSWVARVALHVGYHHLRRKKSRPSDYRTEPMTPTHLDESVLADPSFAPERSEAIRRVREILDLLSPKKREVFILNDLRGMPQEQVAEVVGTSVATVRTRLFYARREFWRRAAHDRVLAQLALVPDADAERGP